MDDVTRVDIAAAAAVDRKAVSGLGRRGGPHSLVRRALRAFIHFFSYHFILSRQNIRVSYAGGFRLTVRPTVFHPKFFISSEKFAEFIDTLDLRGRRVAEIGTGTGILALAAARSWSSRPISIPMPRSRPTRMRAPTAWATASPAYAPI